MNSDLSCVYSVSQEYLVDPIIDLLGKNEIEAFIFNKANSAFPSLTEFEIFVNKESADKASELLKQFESE